MKKKIRKSIVSLITIFALFANMGSILVIENPAWTIAWIPLQLLIYCLSGSWLWLFAIANGGVNRCTTRH